MTISASTTQRAGGSDPSISLLGIDFHAITELRCVAIVGEALAAGRGGWVVTPNLDHLRRLVHQREFRDLCANADIRVADGMPLVWAARIQGTPLPERVAGSNLIWSVSRAAADRGHSVFLLGGDPGTADRASMVLKAHYPTLQVVGTFCPKPGFEKDFVRMHELAEVIDEANPRIVFVALGSPKQERLIEDLRRRRPETWWLGIGISFSFVCGAVRRAPRWMQRFGLEWAHRIVQDPRRLFRRYIIDGIPFAVYLLALSAWKGVRRCKHSKRVASD
jgi:N-acetylglucosaminyldiphosphoundecaprenol N-acetyl-beta-D-mannosaminyltransferase